MQDEINIRLRLIIDKEGLTSSQFTKIIGYMPSSISHILSGRNKPGFDFLKEILKKFDNINSEWLILGSGEMYKTIDKVIDDKKKQTVREKIKASNVESESDHLPYVSDVKVRVDGKKIIKVLIFYSDKTFTEYIPSDM